MDTITKNLVARVNCEDLALYKRLKDKGFVVELIKGKTLIYFQSPSYDLEQKYFDTDVVDFYVELFEHGGGKTNTGEGTVVCGENGQPLVPFEIFTRGHLSCSDHARFLERAAYEVCSDKASHNTTITRYWINYLLENVYVSKDEIWKGKTEALPKALGRFENAVKASYEKCRCYHCRHAHYISLNN